MEIERKFLMDGFPPLPVHEEALVRQGYLSCRPVVRVRSKESGERRQYRLTFKGKGTMVREEIELPIDKDVFDALCGLLHGNLVTKEWKTYLLDDGLVLECSLVDAGTPPAFYYAEVEFDSVEAAQSFVPPAYLGTEVTEDPSYSMNNYWLRTRGTPE